MESRVIHGYRYFSVLLVTLRDVGRRTSLDMCADRIVYHYLESLDSVSSPWIGPGDLSGSPDLNSARHLQIFAEVLMALALGRTVVVPQSYAFDSWGFLNVASRMLAARPVAGELDHPFALHLFGAETFDQAIQQMLRKVRDPTKPFLSSLMPEMSDPARKHEPVPADAEALLQSEWLADGAGSRRADALQSVRTEFSGRPPVPARPRPGNLSLGQAIATFTQQPIINTGQGLGVLARTVHQDLVEALLRLDPSRPLAFNLRSRLRTGDPWPNDKEGRSPEEIAGGSASVELVIEFVDTVYNAVVARSIGIAPVTFTTDIARSDRSLAARAIAQSFAVGLMQSAGSGRQSPGHSGTDRPEDPQFELKIKAPRRLSEPDVQAEMKKLFDSASGGGVAELLAQRAATGQGPSARAPFWTGLDRYHSALSDGDQLAAQRAMDKHLRTVAHMLGRGADGALDSGWRPTLILAAESAGGASSPMLAAVTWHLSNPVAATLTAAGATVPIVMQPVAAAARRRKSSRRIFYALGQTLERMS